MTNQNSLVKSKTALIVDDSRTAYMVLARMLKNYNINAQYASSCDQAIEFLQRQKVDVIFLDQAMPGKDGIETIKELKADPELQSIPIMMFTARSGDDYLREVKALGAIGVLPKELTAEEVESALVKIKLWDVGSDNQIQVDVDRRQPSADEKLRVWLESFLENEFSPKLSNKVQKATDDLRRDTIHYGKRMLDELAKNDKQQAVLEQVKGQTDYLKQLFQNSFRQYRLTSGIFIIALLLLGMGLIWSLLSGQKLQQQNIQIQGELTQLKNQSAITQQLLQEYQFSLEQQLNDKQLQVQENSNDHSMRLLQDHNVIADVIGIDPSGRWISARTTQDYRLLVDENGQISNEPLELFYMDNDCLSTPYVQALPGLILRINSQLLGYTELSSQTNRFVPLSKQVKNECQSYQGDAINVRVLLPNNSAITGVEDMSYHLQ
ncbi:MAG: response regulator [Kangiellaceae bacterium]|nr:response regulator [Kangiellaceae bacterium]